MKHLIIKNSNMLNTKDPHSKQVDLIRTVQRIKHLAVYPLKHVLKNLTNSGMRKLSRFPIIWPFQQFLHLCLCTLETHDRPDHIVHKHGIYDTTTKSKVGAV